MTRPNSNRRGAVLIEATLVVMTFLVMCIGILDLGQFLYRQESLAERVRAVSRTAVVRNYTTNQVVNAIVYNDPASTSTGPGFLGLTRSNVTAAIFDPALNEKRLVVTVQNLSFQTFTPFLPRKMGTIPVRISIPLETP